MLAPMLKSIQARNDVNENDRRSSVKKSKKPVEASRDHIDVGELYYEPSSVTMF